MDDNGKEGDASSTKSLEDQLKEMLQKANLSFMVQKSGQMVDAGAPVEGTQTPSDKEDRMRPIREFNMKPRDIRDYLDRYVIKQDEAKKVLGVAICDHFNHIRRCIENPEYESAEYSKHNIIFMGPTGVGKTYLMRCISRLIGVPFVRADATKFTETGYVGHDVEDLVRDLVRAADGDTELAQYGIIYLDEVDKIAASDSGGGKDVSGRGVQINLLKLMEETEVSLFSQTDIIGQMQAVMEMQKGSQPSARTISTRHILFIVSGAFGQLAERVERRISLAPIGFSHEKKDGGEDIDYLRLVETRDLIDYGFEPEFIGRVPVRVVCDDLSKTDLQAVMLNSEGSILQQYQTDMEGYGIDFSLTTEAVERICEKAHAEKTGARGLMTVLERVFREFKFELPSTRIRSFEITRECVDDPDGNLKELLKTKDAAQRDRMLEDVKSFAQRFESESGLKIVINAEASNWIVDACIDTGKSVKSFCDERFQDFEYGLKLISRNTGRTTFTVTSKLIQSPGEELSRRIAASFKKVK